MENISDHVDLDIVCVEPDTDSNDGLTGVGDLSSSTSMNIICTDQMRVDALLNSGPTITIASTGTTETKKRKMSTMSMSLLQFINLVWEVFNDMTIDWSFEKMPVFKKTLLHYLEDVETKRQKMDEQIDSSHNDSLDFKAGRSRRQQILLSIVKGLYAAMEQKSATVLFPKEMLKYFLATYSNYVTVSDFVSTNNIIKNDRRSKNTGQLTNGLILTEYGNKGLDAFCSSMVRCDPNDIEALKFAIDKQIMLPRKIYQIHSLLPNVQNEYVVDKVFTSRPTTHSSIAISNFKRVMMLVSANVVMIYDNSQFTIPSTNIERDFNQALFSGTQLKKNDFVLLDVLLSTKTKVLDLICYSVKDKHALPRVYADRLKLLNELFPKIKLAAISTATTAGDYSYIQKSNDGNLPSFIYHRSNPTAAVIGTCCKHAVLAFEDKDDVLVVKTKSSILSPALVTILTAPYKNNINMENPTIKFGNVTYKLVGDLTDVRVFETAIPVECREGNKIAHISRRAISQVSEFKPITTNKDASYVENIKKQCDQNPELFYSILAMMAQTNLIASEESKKIIKNIVDDDQPHKHSFGYDM